MPLPGSHFLPREKYSSSKEKLFPVISLQRSPFISLIFVMPHIGTGRRIECPPLPLECILCVLKLRILLPQEKDLLHPQGPSSRTPFLPPGRISFPLRPRNSPASYVFRNHQIISSSPASPCGRWLPFNSPPLFQPF